MRFHFALAGLIAFGLLNSAPDLMAHGGGGGGGGGGWGGHGGGNSFHGGWHGGGFHGNGRHFFHGRFFGPAVGFYGYGYGYPWWAWDYGYYPYQYYGYDAYYSGPYEGNQNGSQGPRFDTPRAVQAALAWRGFYSGRIDGVIGPETRSAIRSFQAHQGLPATGQIDDSLINALRLNGDRR